jgi:hypothetical protein
MVTLLKYCLLVGVLHDNPPKILYRYYSIVVGLRCSRLATLPKAEDTLFEVSGYEVKQTATGQQTTENFTYMTKNVVLATGEAQAQGDGRKTGIT